MTNTTFSRRSFLAATGAFLVLGATPFARAATDRPLLRVTKTPTCGCCGAWVKLASRRGFALEVTDTRDYVGMKTAADVPEDLWSCHTATVEGYVVEGHVPFAAIDKLLAERPNIKGISVPGMPGDSPGMGGGIDAVVPVTAWGGVAGDGAPFPFEG